MMWVSSRFTFFYSENETVEFTMFRSSKISIFNLQDTFFLFSSVPEIVTLIRLSSRIHFDMSEILTKFISSFEQPDNMSSFLLTNKNFESMICIKWDKFNKS